MYKPSKITDWLSLTHADWSERLSEKEGQREVYISYSDFVTMVNQTWEWFRPIMWAAYLSGMRRGRLSASNEKIVDTNSRIIKLTPDRTKEANLRGFRYTKICYRFLNLRFTTSIPTECFERWSTRDTLRLQTSLEIGHKRYGSAIEVS